ncbi:PepSY-associated TM helix domain-containing protein, partial [Brachybacterium alimentarium]|uniref:PepSY-associated TM helix domain-containing protein n=4 Tax=Brachybacterium alimentarium TaxID=47845 RepID=UPI0011C07DDB
KKVDRFRREDRQLTAFVDPYTGEVTGVLNTFEEWLPLRTWCDDLHRNLHLGDAGRWYSEVAASWLWVLALSGLIIWITRKVRTRSARAYLLPQHKGPQRQRSISLHATIGVWAAIGLFFLSATGLTWSQFAGGNFSALRQSLDWSTPYLSSEATTTTQVAEEEVPATTQSVFDVARAEGLGDPVAITPSTDGGAWVVSQVQRSWPLKQDSMAFDPASGAVVESVQFADWPVAGKLAEAGISFHMGILFGWPNQLLLIAIAGAIITLIVIGYRMWWRRRPKPPRTGLPTALGRRVDTAAAYGILIAIAAVVGLALPLLGATLVAFVALDLARRLLGTRHSTD